MSRNSTPDIQFDADGQLRHLLTIDGLNAETIIEILDTAESFISIGQRHIRKVPLLHGRTVVNLFFEPSTRTRTTFEIAAKRSLRPTTSGWIGSSRSPRSTSTASLTLSGRP